MAASTTESEFVAASIASGDVMWARNLLSELGRSDNNATKIYIDNQGALKIIRNPQLHGRTKHIDIVYMFIRCLQERREIDTEYIKSELQRADIMSKSLSRNKHIYFRKMMNVTSLVAVMAAVTLIETLAESKTLRYDLLLDFDNPCDFIPTFTEHPSYSMNFAFRAQLVSLCHKHYDNIINDQLDLLKRQCNLKGKVNRGVIDKAT